MGQADGLLPAAERRQPTQAAPSLRPATPRRLQDSVNARPKSLRLPSRARGNALTTSMRVRRQNLKDIASRSGIGTGRAAATEIAALANPPQSRWESVKAAFAKTAADVHGRQPTKALTRRRYAFPRPPRDAAA